MPRETDFIMQMDAAEIERFETFLCERRRTVDQTMQFLIDELGFVSSKERPEHPRRINRTSVHRAIVGFKIRNASKFASIVDETKKQESTDIQKANSQLLSTLIFEQSLRAQTGKAISPGELLKLSQANQINVKSETELLELKVKGREQMQQLASAAKQKQITPEMIEQVSRAVFG